MIGWFIPMNEYYFCVVQFVLDMNDWFELRTTTINLVHPLIKSHRYTGGDFMFLPLSPPGWRGIVVTVRAGGRAAWRAAARLAEPISL